MLSDRLPARPLLLVSVLVFVLALLAALWSGDSPTAAENGDTKPPARPGGPSLDTEPGSLDVSVDWDDVDGADDYLVRWRRHGPGQELNEGVRTKSSEAEITMGDYGRWVVRVEGCNGAGCGLGASRAVLLQQAKPDRPQNLAVSARPEEMEITASWGEADRATSYVVRWRRPDGGFESGNKVTTTNARAAITVSDYGQWTVRVEGCNDAGCGPGVSHTAGVTPVGPESLAVSATPGELDLAATWDAAAGTSRYRLRWRQVDGEFQQDDLVATTNTNAVITVSDYGEWEVKVEACNSAGCGMPVVRQITQIRVNKPPAIEGAAAHSYASHRKSAVATYAASDPEGKDVTWSLPEGADVDKFSINGSGELKFRTPPIFASPGDADADNRYQVTVRASDGADHTDLAVTVTVTRGNQPPVFTSGPTTVRVPENGYYPINFTAMDPEGDEITWSVAGTDGDRLSFSSAYPFGREVLASLDFRDVPEFERSDDDPLWDHDRDHVYDIIVSVSDQHTATEKAVTVTITNVDEPPVLGGPSEVLRREGSDLWVATYSSSDPEGDTIVWILEGADAGVFTIADGALSFIQGPNFGAPQDNDGDNVYELTVRASDGTDARALSTGKAVRVTVTAATNDLWITNRWSDHKIQENRAEVFATYTAADAQNRPVTWSLEGDDATRLTIAATSGELRFASPPDYDSPADADGDNTYEITVKATAGSGSASRAATVTVTDIDEPPALYGKAEITLPGSGARDVEIYTASDPDGLIMHWGSSGTDVNDFLRIGQGLRRSNAVLRFKQVPDYRNQTDEDADNVYLVTVQARNHESFASQITSMEIRVTVTDPADSPASEPPPRPTGLRAAAQPDTRDIPVSWNNVPEATFYRLRWRRSEGRFEPGNQVDTAATRTTIRTSERGQWVLRLEACNYAGCSRGISEMVTNTEVDAMTPWDFVVSGAPGDLNLAATWKAAADATSYILRWRLVGDGFVPANQVVVTTTEATFGVSGTGEWVVRLEACNDGECGTVIAARVQVEPDPEANRRPVVDEQADEYEPFVGKGNAPQGTLVSKRFDGIFSDPGGDPLTYTVSVADDRTQLVESVYVQEELQRVFIRMDADGDWGAIAPALPDPVETTVTHTATDPDGLSASISGDFRTYWDIPAQPTGLRVVSEPEGLDLVARWDGAHGVSAYRASWRRPDGNFDPGNELSVANTSATITVSGYGK